MLALALASRNLNNNYIDRKKKCIILKMKIKILNHLIFL